ncbi:MAG: hypothetical protein CEE42_09195 [Promethearchaeota archaeon Loki_b31]|nr:MAG: hypothetical protein CEE42_09195 [Candidatus Lokiarchaeota archaeon Loki_b31]
MNELYIDLLELIKEDYFTKEIIALLEDRYDFCAYGSVIEGLSEFKGYTSPFLRYLENAFMPNICCLDFRKRIIY